MAGQLDKYKNKLSFPPFMGTEAQDFLWIGKGIHFLNYTYDVGTIILYFW
jgi:hypothetical protein